MSYIGNKPATSFETVQKQISTSNSGTTITLDRSVTSVQDILLTIDAVVQSYDNYSVSGTTLTVGGTLSNNRVEILYVGRTMQSVDPTDDSVSAAKIKTDAVTTAKVQNDAITVDKLNLVSTSSVPSLEAKGDGGSQDGYIQLNCSQNSHGVKLKSPPHSANQSYTLTLPSTAPATDKMLQTNSSGVLSFVDAPSGGLALVGSVSQSSNTASVTMDNVFSATYDSYLLIFDATSNGNGDFIIHFRSSGGSPATITASNYKYAFSGIDGTDASSETAYGNNNSQFQVGHGLYNNTQLDYPAISGFFYFNSPFSSTHTKHWHGNFFTLNSNGDTRAYAGGGALINQTSLGGVRFSFSSNDVNNLTARMYGLVNS